MENPNFKNAQEALDFVKKTVEELSAAFTAANDLAKILIEQNVCLELEKARLQARNDVLCTALEVFKNA